MFVTTIKLSSRGCHCRSSETRPGDGRGAWSVSAGNRCSTSMRNARPAEVNWAKGARSPILGDEVGLPSPASPGAGH